MNQRSFLDDKMQKCIEYQDLKTLNKTVTAEVLTDFRSQAFGDDIEDCVSKIEKEIGAKYLQIKKKFIRQYEQQLKDLLQPKITLIESKIRQGKYEKA